MALSTVPAGGLSSDSVTTAKIVDDAVTGAKIENSPTIAANLTVSGTTDLTGKVTASGDVEGFGIAILEANALGLPAIGSKGSGIEDAIKHGFSGQLVDPFDPKQILDAIDKIYSDYTAYSQNALDWSQGFQWEKVVEKYKEVMQELLG